MTTATVYTPKPNRYDRAQTLGQNGYTIASSIYVQNLFHITKADNTKYIVDAVRRTCTCPATVPDCAHLIFTDNCLRYVAQLTRKQSYVASLLTEARTLNAARIAAGKAEEWTAHDSAVANFYVLIDEIVRVTGHERGGVVIDAQMEAARVVAQGRMVAK